MADTHQNTNYQRGDVVAFTDPFKLGDDVSRPFLIINNDVAPFVDEQYIAVALTTTPWSLAHPLHEKVWERGRPGEPSYALPWSVHSPRHEDATRHFGHIREKVVDMIVDELQTFISA